MIGEGENKTSTTIQDYLGLSNEDYSKVKVEGHKIGGKGLDAYEISVFNKDGDKTQMFTAGIPLRKESNKLQSEKLVNSPDINVSNFAKTNLAIEYVDNWNINNAYLLPNNESIPLTIHGKSGYTLTKENDMFHISGVLDIIPGKDEDGRIIRVPNKHGKSTAITDQYEKAEDALAGLYDFFNP